MKFSEEFAEQYNYYKNVTFRLTAPARSSFVEIGIAISPEACKRLTANQDLVEYLPEDIYLSFRSKGANLRVFFENEGIKDTVKRYNCRLSEWDFFPNILPDLSDNSFAIAQIHTRFDAVVDELNSMEPIVTVTGLQGTHEWESEMNRKGVREPLPLEKAAVGLEVLTRECTPEMKARIEELMTNIPFEIIPMVRVRPEKGTDEIGGDVAIGH